MLSAAVVSNVEASCDWLTRTFSEVKVRQEAYERANAKLQQWANEGHDVSSWDWMGYSGFACAGLSWGTRNDCDLLRLSGSTAETLFDDYCRLPGNCSRIDVAMTFTLAHPIAGVASRAYRNLAILQEPAHTRNYSLIVNNRGGETLYVGSRASDQFGRLYDKGIEDGGRVPGERWRYEVEFKGARAVQALARLTSTADRRTMYVALVQSFFLSRNVALPSMQRGLEIELPVAVEHKSIDRQLAWLRRQVAPVVARLLDKGHEEDVRQALGITKE